MSARAAPLRAVVFVLVAWTGARIAIVAGGRAALPVGATPAAPHRSAPLTSPAPSRLIATAPSPLLLAAAGPVPRMPMQPSGEAPTPGDGGARLGHDMDPSALLLLAAYSSAARAPDGGGRMAAADFGSAPSELASGAEAAPAAPLLSVAPRALETTTRRWSGSAWLYARGGDGAPPLGQSQIGGAQAGARIVYRLDDAGRFGLVARGSSPLHQHGAEIAGGVEWHPVQRLPLRLAIERRVRLERGGRSAWQATAAGGYDGEPIPGALRVDAYAQAGVVGARARDLFADGSVRAGYPIHLGARTALTAGGGIWGAAQPGAARLDVGPQAALRLPAGDAGLLLAIDWRLRAAGKARPGSGPAVTLAADF